MHGSSYARYCQDDPRNTSVSGTNGCAKSWNYVTTTSAWKLPTTLVIRKFEWSSGVLHENIRMAKKRTQKGDNELSHCQVQ